MDNSELSIVFDKKARKKNIPYEGSRFKPIKIEKNYYKELVKEYITIWNIRFIIPALIFNRHIEYLWMNLIIALLLVVIKKNGNKSWVSYTITSILMWKFFVISDGTMQCAGYTVIFLLSYSLILILIMASLEVFGLYQEFLLNIIRRKIMDRFPLNKKDLELCGVHNRFECLIYYQYMMHGFGRFKDPVIDFSDCGYKEIKNLQDIFYAFPMTREAEEKVDQAVKKGILSKQFIDIILNKKQYSFFSDSNPAKDFANLLFKSKMLYDDERSSGTYI